MSVSLYMDVHVPASITRALRARGVDVLTAQEDGTDRFDDPLLLDRTRREGRCIFTRDEDFLTETAARQRGGKSFVGVIYAHQLRVTIGQCVRDLELIAKCCDPGDLANQVEHLPLR